MYSVDDIANRLRALDNTTWLGVGVGALVGLIVAPSHRIIGALVGAGVSLGFAVASGPCCASCADKSTQPNAGGPSTSPPPPPPVEKGATDSPGGPATKSMTVVSDPEGPFTPIPDLESFWKQLPRSLA